MKAAGSARTSSASPADDRELRRSTRPTCPCSPTRLPVDRRDSYRLVVRDLVRRRDHRGSAGQRAAARRSAPAARLACSRNMTAVTLGRGEAGPGHAQSRPGPRGSRPRGPARRVLRAGQGRGSGRDARGRGPAEPAAVAGGQGPGPGRRGSRRRGADQLAGAGAPAERHPFPAGADRLADHRDPAGGVAGPRAGPPPRPWPRHPRTASTRSPTPAPGRATGCSPTNGIRPCGGRSGCCPTAAGSCCASSRRSAGPTTPRSPRRSACRSAALAPPAAAAWPSSGPCWPRTLAGADHDHPGGRPARRRGPA